MGARLAQGAQLHRRPGTERPPGLRDVSEPAPRSVLLDDLSLGRFSLCANTSGAFAPRSTISSAANGPVPGLAAGQVELEVAETLRGRKGAVVAVVALVADDGFTQRRGLDDADALRQHRPHRRLVRRWNPQGRRPGSCARA
jgi:hypothetical protein